jgi:hypothetical protein
VKPKPPVDLWEKMDALNKTIGFDPSNNNDNGFTVFEYAERYGLPEGLSRCRLKRMADRGQLIKGRSVRNGKTCLVYRFPDEVTHAAAR